ERRRITRDRDRRFWTIFQAAPMGIVQSSLDGRILDMNPSAQRMLGRDLSELRGEAFTTFLHPDDRAQDAELFHELAAGRREGYEHDLRYVRKDGGSGFMHLKVSLVRDFDAKPHFALAMIVDMTERKR